MHDVARSTLAETSSNGLTPGRPARERTGLARFVRVRRAMAATGVALMVAFASAAAPCGQVLAGYFDVEGGTVQPCLVDLQENGLCFALPGMGLDMSVRTLDAHLQSVGVPRPYWEAGPVAEATRFEMSSGDRLEIVLSSSGPFETTGSCRIVPER